MASRILQCCTVPQTLRHHSAVVIFMHGSGGTGPLVCASMKSVLGQDLTFPHIRLLYPTAPLQPYTPSNGFLQHVWFNRHSVSLTAKEDLTTIEPIAEEISRLIDEEVSRGIDSKRIILGGFSMGASLAMQMGYRFRQDIGGVFVLSSFLNQDSKVYEMLECSSASHLPPLLMAHGKKDDVVPHAWGQHTFLELQKRGVQGTFSSIPNLYHSVNRHVLQMLQKWIMDQVPES